MRRVRRILSCFIVLFVISSNSNCQNKQYNFRQISIEQGLPGQNVRQVYQDYNGIMWISVEAIGLCRYDGRSFHLYSNSIENEGSISSNYVNAILEDADSNLWIATENGLNRYDRTNGNFKNYYADTAVDNGLPNSLINDLFNDRYGNLWVGTGDGLCKYNANTDSFELVNLISSDVTLVINTIMQHTSGILFIGTNRGLIQYSPYDGSTFHWRATQTSDNNLVHNIIRAIYEDSSGELWIATHRGINKLNYSTKKITEWKYSPADRPEFEDEGYNDIYSNDGRHVWLSSYTNGIIIIDSKTGNYSRIQRSLYTPEGLKSNHIRHIFQDRSGLLWVSTKFEGIFLYDRRKEIFNNIPEKYAVFQSLKNLHILAFFDDKVKNKFWIGTKYNGLFEVDIKSGELTNFRHDIGNLKTIGSNRVQSIFRDSYGDLWVGLGNGLDCLNESTNGFKHYSTIFSQAIVEDMNNRLWIGTSEGVYVFNREEDRLERFTISGDVFFTNDAMDIMSMHSDKVGQLWFSTRINGLFKYNILRNEVTRYSSVTNQSGFRGDAVRSIAEDLEGRLWIGTKYDGVCTYNQFTESFTYLNMDKGLPSNFVMSIQQDQNFNFWFGTHNGLSFYNKSLNRITNYNTVHGLQGNIFEPGVNAMFDDGYLLFGGHNGLNIFHPNYIGNANIQSKDSILITSIKVFDEKIASDVSEATSIKLNHKQNYITIEFVLLDFFNSGKHTFSYRMNGISDKWFDLGNKNYITFSGVNPGEYVFEVKGTNEFGIESQVPLSVSISISKPFYKTWLSRILILLIVSVIVIIVLRARVVRAKSARKKLETQVLERTESLKNANEILKEQYSLIEQQKKEIESNKENLEEKVEERTRDLELAKLKAEESDRLKSSFLANMSHEIRTPLNAILGFSSLISEGVSDEDILLDYQAKIYSNSDMLTRIVDDILDLSKIESEQFEIDLGEFGLREFLAEINEEVKELFLFYHKTHLTFSLNIDLPSEEEYIIESDKIRLRQVIKNLVSNAIKFTHKGFIEIGVTIKDEKVQFYVKDSGVGIKKEDFSRIFERFSKIENADVLYRGNGLGLCITHHIVGFLGGEIWLDSIYNYGSTFYFTIPFMGSMPTNTKEETKIQPIPLNTMQKDAILIVEDEESNYLLLNALLKNFNMKLLWARDGVEALNIIDSNDGKYIKLIMMDIKMPNKDGYRTFSEIRSKGIETPIVAVTAYSQLKDKKKMIDFGFNDYIAKPINVTKVRRIIRTIV